MLTKLEFIKFQAMDFNLIPVWKKMKIQDISALDIYQALKCKKKSYLFEVRPSEKEDVRCAYSVIGLKCDFEIQINGFEIKMFSNSHVVEEIHVADPLGWISGFLKKFFVPKINELGCFAGGLFGFFGFNTINMIETKLNKKNVLKEDLLKHPDISLLLSNELIILNHDTEEVIFIVLTDSNHIQNYDVALEKINKLQNKILRIKPGVFNGVRSQYDVNFSELHYLFPKEDFEKSVAKIKEYIREGEVMQVVLSQRISRDFNGGACKLYEALRKINISPYTYLIDLGHYQIVGASPETLVRCLDGKITARPIGGTRPRGLDVHDEALINQELISDDKENAEHIMLVDLARSDLGRIAQFGSIHLDEFLAVEKYSHVMHLVSTVTGKLEKDKNVIDVLKAVFPAGTLSGVPKVKALEIIHELEPFSRGMYGGGIGYLDWHGDMDLAIAIRTGLIQDDKLYVQAGASIVADSEATLEWEEACNKGKALLYAALLAEQ